MRQSWQDLVYAARVLRKSPGFAAVAILSLALGIGATSSMFSFADAIVLRPIDVPRGSELLVVSASTKSDLRGTLSWRDYLDYRDSASTLANLLAYQEAEFGVSVAPGQLPQLSHGMLVSGNFFRGLGLPLAMGRDFRPEEDSPAAAASPAAIVSHSFWKDRMGGDPGVLGRRIRLNGNDFTVIGVAPERFRGLHPMLTTALFVPVHTLPLVQPNARAEQLEDRASRGFGVLGRLAGGATVESAQAECRAIAARLERAYPATNRDRTVLVERELKARFAQQGLDGTAVLALVGIAALVLLIACANLANLMLARGVARTRELAIRLAVGAGRMRLIRQLLTESLLLSALGGAVGLVVAAWAIRALALIKLPTDMPVAIATRMDLRVVLFTLAATTMTGVLFGLAPALRASRTDVMSCIKGAATVAGVGRGRFTLRNALAVAQVAVAFAVLSAAGMLVNSFLASRRLDVGFRTDGILMASLDPGLVRMDAAKGAAFFHRVAERVRGLPGVELATVARQVPLGFSYSPKSVVVDGYEMPRGQDRLRVESNTVGPQYFRAMGIPILRGRGFDDRDRAGAARVVVINETMARRYWPARDPLGAHIHLDSADGPEATVIGVARNAKYRSTYESPRAHVYLPFEQDYHERMTLLVLAAGGSDPAALSGAVRAEVRALEPDVPVFDVRTFREFYRERILMPPRVLSEIVSAFGAVGLGLAAIGLYGVIAYTVSRRTREIGIRMALGAARGHVARSVMRDGLGLTVTGLLLGFPLAWALSRVVIGMTVSRAGNPAPAWLATSLVLALVSVAAAWIPARRASRVSPSAALRYE